MKATPIPMSSRLAVRARARDRCERCGVGTQSGEWHHRRSRSVRDDLTHNERNGVYLCTTCHAWCHAHPLLARNDGFIVSRHADPTQVPIKHWSLGEVYLLSNATYGRQAA